MEKFILDTCTWIEYFLFQFVLEVFNKTINGFRHCFEARIIIPHDDRRKVICTINVYVHAP